MTPQHDREWRSFKKRRNLHIEFWGSWFLGGYQIRFISSVGGEVSPLFVVSIFALTWIRFHHTSHHQ
jgi:hypothetical protein